VNDIKHGYGEMYWNDETIFRGYWDEGLQDGIGLMIFKDGERKAGFFEANIYRRPLKNWKEFEDFAKQFKKQSPETFR